MNKKGGLGRRLGRAFTLQAIFVSVTAVLSVLVAGVLIKEVMIKQALKDEAEYFVEQRTLDPDFALPNTRNLTVYVVGESSPIPPKLASLEPGFHELKSVPDFSLAYVVEREGERIILLFDGQRVGMLVVWFGIIPFSAVLVTLYLISLFMYRATRRAISPIVQLSHEVDQLHPGSVDCENDLFQVPEDADSDTQMLARALRSYADRLQSFVERETNFTRDASHELRSPLTVIRIAADMLLSEQELSPQAKKSVHRIKRGADDMERMTEAFLMLARESDGSMSSEQVSVNQIAREELELVQPLVQGRPIKVSLEANCELLVEAPDSMLGVLIGNLIRNAANYTDEGEVTVSIDPQELTVRDSGIGIEAENLESIFAAFNRGAHRRRGGHGVGLTIVQRISDRFNWPVTIASEIGVGTTVKVRFPKARVQTAAPTIR